MGYKTGGVNPVIEGTISEDLAAKVEQYIAEQLGGARGAKSEVIREALSFWIWSIDNNSRLLKTFRKTYDPGVTAGRSKGSKNKT